MGRKKKGKQAVEKVEGGWLRHHSRKRIHAVKSTFTPRRTIMGIQEAAKRLINALERIANSLEVIVGRGQVTGPETPSNNGQVKTEERPPDVKGEAIPAGGEDMADDDPLKLPDGAKKKYRPVGKANKEETKRRKKEDKKESTTTTTVEELRSKIRDFAKENGLDAAQLILNNYGAKKIRDIEACDYDAVAAECDSYVPAKK